MSRKTPFRTTVKFTMDGLAEYAFDQSRLKSYLESANANNCEHFADISDTVHMMKQAQNLLQTMYLKNMHTGKNVKVSPRSKRKMILYLIMLLYNRYCSECGTDADSTSEDSCGRVGPDGKHYPDWLEGESVQYVKG